MRRHKPCHRKYGFFFFYHNFQTIFYCCSSHKTRQKATTDGISKDPGKDCEEPQVLPYLKANKLPGHHFTGFGRRDESFCQREEFSTRSSVSCKSLHFSSCPTGPGGHVQGPRWVLNTQPVVTSPAVSLDRDTHNSTIQLEKSKQGQPPLGFSEVPHNNFKRSNLGTRPHLLT